MAESRTFSRLIQELEHLIHLSSYHVDVCKKRILAAKEVMNVPSSNSVSKSEPAHLDDIPCYSRDEEAYNSIQEDILEEEITRILQLAENVRDKSLTKQHQKSRVSSHLTDVNVARTVKGPSPRSRLNSTSVKSEKKTLTKSDKKTVYQKDYSLIKSKSMPSLLVTSKGNEFIKSRAPERKFFQDMKVDSVQSKTVGLNSRHCSPRRNKDFIKLNKQNLGQVKKESLRNTRSSRGVSKSAPRLLQSCKVNDSCLSEELALRTQLPKNSEILTLLRDIHNFLTGSNRKAGKKEITLKENFIKRCNSSVSGSSLDPELHGVLDVSISHCGWAFGESEMLTSNELSNMKDTMSKLEKKLDKLKNPSCDDYVVKTCSENHEDENNKNYYSLQENLKLNMSPFWHPFVMSSVFQGVELPPFLYYSNVHEWISFQSVVLELQEYFIQLKILENILPIIAEFMASIDSLSNGAENTERNTLLARTLKAAAIMGDFTGNLTVPMLASIKPSDESSASS